MALRTITAERSAVCVIALVTTVAIRWRGHDRCGRLQVARLAFQADVRPGEREAGSLMIELPARPRECVVTILAIRP